MKKIVTLHKFKVKKLAFQTEKSKNFLSRGALLNPRLINFLSLGEPTPPLTKAPSYGPEVDTI